MESITVMHIPTDLLIPLADQQALAEAEQRREARLAKRRAQAAKRRKDPAYVQRTREYDRKYRLEHRETIAATHARYEASPKAKATRSAWYKVQRLKLHDPLAQLATKFTNNLMIPINMKKPIISPPKSSPRGRPAWLIQFAQENHITLAELRQVSRLVARQRQVQKEMADLEQEITARATAAAKATKEA